MLFVGTTNSQQQRSRSKDDLVGPINSSRGQQRSSFTCLNYDLRGRGTRIEFGFDFSGLCRVRGRGSPRFGAARRPLGSKKSKRPVVSHRWKGGISCISGLSTNNVYRRWSSPSPTTPGVQAIPRLVIACYRSPSCPLPSVEHIFRERPREQPLRDKLRQNVGEPLSLAPIICRSSLSCIIVYIVYYCYYYSFHMYFLYKNK